MQNERHDNNGAGFGLVDKNAAPRARTILLGTVAAAALAGALVDGAFLIPHSANAAQPAASAQPLQMAPNFADTVERVKASVVSVKVKLGDGPAQVASGEGDEDGLPQFAPGSPLERFFRQYGGQGFKGQKPQAPRGGGMSQGSGFFISADGYIVTNNHVVENAKEVVVTTVDGKDIPATVVGTDKRTDLALLKTKEGGNYPFATFAAKAPRVGEWVIAVGNPFGLGGTVTAGIVSARGRDIGAGPYDNFLQIDAPVNRGNSGGPTFNVEGEVVGVNTAIYSPSGGSVGIGFAIDTADAAREVIASLKEKGTVARGWLGVQIQPVTADIADSLGLKEPKGALIADVTRDGPAAEAGLKSGDVVTAVNGDAIKGPRELARKIASIGPEKKAEVTLLRSGAEKRVSVELAALPDDAKGGKPAAKAAPAPLASLGMALETAKSVPGAGKEGVVVTEVDPEGQAAQKGLKPGDVILEAAGQPVTRPGDVAGALDKARKDGAKAVLFRVKSAEGVRFVAIVPKQG